MRGTLHEANPKKKRDPRCAFRGFELAVPSDSDADFGLAFIKNGKGNNGMKRNYLIVIVLRHDDGEGEKKQGFISFEFPLELCFEREYKNIKNN